MSPLVLKLLVGVTAVLPVFIALAGTLFYDKTLPETPQRVLVRILTPLLWIVSVIGLYMYWNYFNTWQTGHHQTDEGIDIIMVISVVIFHVMSGGFAYAVATDKLSTTETEAEAS